MQGVVIQMEEGYILIVDDDKDIRNLLGIYLGAVPSNLYYRFVYGNRSGCK